MPLKSGFSDGLGGGTYSLIMKDLSRFGNRYSTRHLFVGVLRIFTNHSFKLTFWWRLASHCKESSNVLCKIAYPLLYVIHSHNEKLLGITLPIGTHIGGGLVFPHFSGIVIHGCAIIGENCTIHQCVTIGTERRKSGYPQIGDNCVLGAGAKIIGNVKLGNNVMVGANAVVCKNVPAGAVVAGIPAKILSLRGEDYVKLRI